MFPDHLTQAVIGRINDARLLADYNAWIKRAQQATYAHIIQIQWPAVDIFAGQKPDPPGNGSDCSPLKPRVDRRRRPRRRNRALAEGDGRLYFLTYQPPRIAYVPLDDHGRPIGKSVRSRKGPFTVWDNIKDIPQPNREGFLCLTSARYVDGKLCVATHGIGLQVFDPKTETWKGYGPEQGLPSGGVDEFFPLGGRVLYCNANRTHFMLNVADGAVTLVHRPDPKNWWAADWPPGWKMCLVQRNGGQVMGIDEVRHVGRLAGQRAPAAPAGRPFPLRLARRLHF